MRENEEGRPSGKESRPSNHYDAETQRPLHTTTAPGSVISPGTPESGSALPPARSDGLPPVMDAKAASSYLQISQNTLYELCRRGELPARRVGRQLRFSRSQLERWIEGGAA